MRLHPSGCWSYLLTVARNVSSITHGPRWRCRCLGESERPSKAIEHGMGQTKFVCGAYLCMCMCLCMCVYLHHHKPHLPMLLRPTGVCTCMCQTLLGNMNSAEARMCYLLSIPTLLAVARCSCFFFCISDVDVIFLWLMGKGIKLCHMMCTAVSLLHVF